MPPHLHSVSATHPGIRRRPISKPVLLVLALCLGGLGAHRYYLRRYLSGLCYSLLFWTPLPWLLGWGDALRYARRSEVVLQRRYRDRLSGGKLCLVQAAGLLPAFALGAVLVGLGLPAYRMALDRARVGTVITALAPVRHAIVTYRQRQGVYPPGWSALGEVLPGDNPYLGSLAVLPMGRLEMVFNDRAASLAGQTLVFTPHAMVHDPRGLDWDCVGGTLDARYRPPACQMPEGRGFRPGGHTGCCLR